MSEIVITDEAAINRVVVEESVIRVIRAEPQEPVRVVSVGTQGPGGSSSLRIGTATWASSMTLNWGNFDLIRVVLEGDTVFAFTAVTDGRRVILELVQDAVGDHEVTWPGNVRYSASLPMISLSIAPNATDRVGFIFNGLSNTFDVMAVARGF